MLKKFLGLRMMLAASIWVCLSAASAMAQSCSGGLPYSFTSGTTISAAQMNANFAYITSCFATLGANTFTGMQTLPSTSPTSLQAATKAYVDAAVAGGGGSGGAGFVNRFRNATFVSWPNGTGGVTGNVPTSGSGSTLIAANGWACQATGAAGTWSRQTTGQNGNYYSLRVAGATSNSDLKCSQRLGGADAAGLAGKQVTVQITVKNVTGANLNVQVSTCYASAFETFSTCTGDLSAVNMATTACAANATCTFAYSFQTSTTANTVSNGYSVTFDFGGIGSSSSYVELSAPDIRLTPGVSAGPVTSPPTPELRDMASELMRNAAYYQSSYDNGVIPGSSTSTGMVVMYASTGSDSNAAWNIPLPVAMRATPTMSYWDRVGNAGKASFSYNGGSNWVDNANTVTTQQSGTKSVLAYLNANGVAVPRLTHFTAYADFW